ncbi:MAG: leucine-rich repeat protein [Candidatus Methanomethylophilaceae archaeon]|nr:leucine-rich repeat protein [Candidatus Methanomethylophilaceae archaeon]
MSQTAALRRYEWSFVPALALAAVALLAVLSSPISENCDAASSGTCGDGLTWNLDDSGILTISGQGSMDDYGPGVIDYHGSSESPWGKDVESVTIEDGVASIGECAFADCSSLASIAIPASVESIGAGAFKKCVSLSSITIPGPVKAIEEEAFLGCASLAYVSLPDSLESIDEFAFCKCTSLACINIPDSVRSINANVFETGYDTYEDPWYMEFYDGDSGLYYNDLHGYVYAGVGDCKLYRQRCTLECSPSEDGQEAVITGFSGTADYVVIPPVYDGYRITAVADRAFYGCEDLKRIVFSDSVKTVGKYAFFRCASLESVEFGSVESVGLKSFSYSQSLRSIETPAALKKIGGYAFYGSGLESLEIPGNDVAVGKGAFSQCADLGSVSFTGSGVKIGTKAFYNDVSLSSLDLSGVASIGMKAFPYCDGLVTLEIPGSVATVGMYAFYRCANLKNLIVVEGVDGIGRSAFSQCLSLEYVSLPDSISRMGSNAFYGIVFEDQDGNAMETTLDLCGHAYAGTGKTLRMAGDGEDVYMVLTGSCGENLRYSLDNQGTLTISGTGQMYDYSWASFTRAVKYSSEWGEKGTTELSFEKSTAPWYEDLGPADGAVFYRWGFADIRTTNAYPIKSIVIEEGVTSVGEYAFSDYCDYGWMVEEYNSPTQSISFPDTLVTVGNYAFNGFRFLDADGKSIPASAESLRGHTFELAYWMTFRMAS